MPRDVLGESEDCTAHPRLLAAHRRQSDSARGRHLPEGHQLLSGLLQFFAAVVVGLIRPQHRHKATARRCRFGSLGPHFDNIPLSVAVSGAMS
jgi:hypothetical protein